MAMPAPQMEDKLAVLRELRAEVQDIQTLLGNVQQGKAAIGSYASYLEVNRNEVAALFQRLNSVAENAATAVPSDSIGRLSNLWQQLLCTSVVSMPHSVIDAELLIKELAVCDELCNRIVAYIGHLTIPARLNGMLANAWTGYLLSFHDLFADELPRAEDRQRVLRFLASVPGVLVGGVVEPENGLIFPYHRNLWKRVGVCLSLLLFAVGATVGFALLGQSSGVRELAGVESSGLVVNWLLVVAGGLVHLGVDRNKGSGVKASVPVSHLSAAIDARAGTIVLRLLLMVFAYCGLIFLGGSGNNSHLNAFLVGYSLDSFVELFSSTLDKKAAERGSALSKLPVA